MSTLLRFDEAVIRQQRKNLRQKRMGDILRLGDLADASKAIVGEPGEIDDGAQRVVTLTRELQHESYQTHPIISQPTMRTNGQ